MSQLFTIATILLIKISAQLFATLDESDSRIPNPSSNNSAIVNSSPEADRTTLFNFPTIKCRNVEDNESGKSIPLYDGEKLYAYCLCKKEFFGNICQYPDKCYELVDRLNLTGNEICKKIYSTCIQNDIFFKCKCNAGEYFYFNRLKSNKPILDYEVACRKTDKCLGVKCRHLTEICDSESGQCICDSSRGYSLHEKNNDCRLLNKCKIPDPISKRLPCSSVNKRSKCVPTWDSIGYTCVCPVGFEYVKPEEANEEGVICRATSLLCEVPILNRCQQKCSLNDSSASGYSCSCFNGFKKGTNIDQDDHMCYVDFNAFNRLLRLEDDNFNTTHPSIDVTEDDSTQAYNQYKEKCKCPDKHICIINEAQKRAECVCERQGFVLLNNKVANFESCIDWCSQFKYEQVDEQQKQQNLANLKRTCFVSQCGEKVGTTAGKLNYKIWFNFELMKSTGLLSF